VPCEHLSGVHDAARMAGARVVSRGQAWTGQRGEWVYFDCRFSRPSLEARLDLARVVEWHEHRGTHDGSEAGFVCRSCEAGVMGRHPQEPGSGPVVS
jgi:hypothetical protein